eukprot:gene4333-6637_t
MVAIVQKLSAATAFALAVVLSAFLLFNHIKVQALQNSIVHHYQSLVQLLFSSTWIIAAMSCTLNFMTIQPWDAHSFCAVRDQFFYLFFFPVTTGYLALTLSNNLVLDVPESLELTNIQEFGVILFPYSDAILLFALVSGFLALEQRRRFQSDFAVISIFSTTIALLLRSQNFALSITATISMIYFFWTSISWAIIDHFHPNTSSLNIHAESLPSKSIFSKTSGLNSLQSDVIENNPSTSSIEANILPIASTPKRVERSTALHTEDEGTSGSFSHEILSNSNAENRRKSLLQRPRNIALPRRKSKPLQPLATELNTSQEMKVLSYPPKSIHTQSDNNEKEISRETSESSEEGGEEQQPDENRPYILRSPVDEARIPKSLKITAPGPKSPGAGLPARRLRKRPSVTYRY